MANLWEAEFLVQIAGKAVALRDDAYLAACRSRAVLLCAHALHAIDGRWLVTEKGAVASAAASPWAPRLFAERVVAALGDEDEASRLVAEVRRRCEEALSCPSRGLDRLDRRTT